MKAPCKDCDRRALGCHDHCEEYKEFRAEIERIKAVRGWVKNQQDYFGSLALNRRKKKK